MHDTCAIHGIRILITNPPKLDNKPHVTRLNGGLRPLSRPLIRSSRGRSGALVGWDGCEVRLCVRVPVCVPAPPGVFLPVLYCTQFHSFPNSLKPRRGSHFSKGVITDAWQKDPANPRPTLGLLAVGRTDRLGRSLTYAKPRTPSCLIACPLLSWEMAALHGGLFGSRSLPGVTPAHR